MTERKCYACFHSQTWTLQEHKDGVKKFCHLKWEDVNPNDVCGYWCPWMAAHYYGVTIRGVAAEPEGLYERVI